MPIYTIGHSTRALDELVALLREHDVQRLADIRRYPGSRRYPHFSRDALEVSLPEHRIEYIHIPELGGRRKSSANSPNMALRNEQFRAYADHMASDEFRHAVEGLLGARPSCAPRPCPGAATVISSRTTWSGAAVKSSTSSDPARGSSMK
jgi:hypothetical protein